MKNRRFVITVIILALLILVALDIEYYYLQIETDATTRFLIIFLFNFSVISLLTLMFFVGKHLFRLWIEKRRRIIGYKFKTRIVATFVILTLVPSLMLFLIAGEIVTNYIDRWFDPQIERPLRDSVELAKTFYELERERTFNKARKVIRGEIFRDNIKVFILTEVPQDASETIRNAFEGKEGTEVITREDADVIRAVIPEVIGGKVRRVFVAESLVPPGIVERIENVRAAQGKYAAMKKLKIPLKMNYLLVLAFFTSLIVFMALWVSLRIARGITDPISALATATEDIAGGNLDINIDMERDDEVGMLVTSFNRMVRELRESKASLENAYVEADSKRVLLKSIVDNVDAGVISFDDEGRIQIINDSACRILGLDPALFLENERDSAFLLNQVESDELRSFIRGIDLRDSRPLREQKVFNLGGRKLILRIFITRLSLADGQRVGMLVVFDDLTDIIRAQQALTWQDVARRIAHEIKNPLTPIKLSAERILKKWSSNGEDIGDTIEKASNTIIREVEDLKKLVNEFTRFGRMPELEIQETDVHEIITNVMDLYSDYPDISIEVDLPQDMPLLMLDSEQFKRVIINLFNNAINAMDGRGRITVRGRFNGRGDRFILEVSDTGTGIDESDLDKLFLPYFSKKKDGTGLGLAISHMIVTKHGGTMSASNNETGGAKFSVELPV